MNPVIFIVGCGRSGSTILGKTLGSNKNVVYLNEPRGLWKNYFKKTDVWSDNKPKLRLDSKDAGHIPKLRFRVRASTIADGKQLIEKTPINSFRIPFLLKIFPNAKFIYIGIP